MEEEEEEEEEEVHLNFSETGSCYFY